MGLLISGVAKRLARPPGILAAAASGSSLFDRRLETSLALDGPSIKPPCRMTERRHGDREADKERERAQYERGRDDEAPKRDGDRILARDPQRSGYRRNKPYVAIEQERKRDDADAERPVTTSSQPRLVVRTSRKKGMAAAGGSGP